MKVFVFCALILDYIGVWEDPRTGWIEGTAILIAVFIVALVTSTNNYSKVLNEVLTHQKSYNMCRSSSFVS